MTKLITFAGNVLVFFGDWLLSLAFDREEEARRKRAVDAALAALQDKIVASDDPVFDVWRAPEQAGTVQVTSKYPLIGYWEQAVSQRVPCPCEDCARNREMRRRAAN